MSRLARHSPSYRRYELTSPPKDYPGLGLHDDHQEGLAINGVPAADREHWMRVANNAVREINGDACAIAPFGVAVVNTTSNELVCVAANRAGITGSEWGGIEVGEARPAADGCFAA